MRELFSHDPLTGMTIWFDYNEATDETTLEYEQDAEPFLEANKKMANDPDVWKQGVKNDMALYASIPVGLQMKWLIEDGLDIYDNNAWPQLFARLNSPEYQYLKTTTKFHGGRGRLFV